MFILGSVGVGVCKYEVLPLVVVVFAPESDELTHVMEPTCTVFVLNSDGWSLVNGSPAAPVPLA